MTKKPRTSSTSADDQDTRDTLTMPARSASEAKAHNGSGATGSARQHGRQPAGKESQPAVPIEDQVRRRAFERFENRCANNEPGDCLSDWLEAEREVLAQSGKKRSH